VVAALALTWFMGDRLLGVICDSLVMRSHFRFARVYGSEEAAYAIVLGDSRGVNTFHAPTLSKVIGKHVFSLAYNGCSADVSAALLADWCQHHPAPKVVVIEVTSTLRDASVLKSLKMFIGRSRRLSAALGHEYPAIRRACDLSHLYRFNSEMFLRTLFYVRASDQDWINRYRISSALVEESEREGAGEVMLGEAQPNAVEGLRQIKALCSGKGIALRFVIGPYMPLYRNRIADLDKLRDNLERSVGVKIYDYSHAVTDVACFADNVHMNIKGSDELTRRLLRDGVFLE
jgi:hypothetical protein